MLHIMLLNGTATVPTTQDAQLESAGKDAQCKLGFQHAGGTESTA